MSEIFQNDPKAGKSDHSPVRKISCEEWEAMLVDHLDGTLSAGEPAIFHAHRETCAACAEMFTQAGQGREWLNFLRTEPEAPITLVARILAQTSGAESRAGVAGQLAPAAAVVVPVAPVVPFWKQGALGFAGRQVSQPRLLMTAAMAFFSITLTLNMAGVRLSTIRLADLNPSAMSSTLNKQYHQASARFVRYYDNLRFVYEMEAQVREMRRNADLENSTPSPKPQQSAPASAPGDGHKTGGRSQVPANPSGREQQSAILWGEKVDAALSFPQATKPLYQPPPSDRHSGEMRHTKSNIAPPDCGAADQAERRIA